jgi:hypothetical protein
MAMSFLASVTGSKLLQAAGHIAGGLLKAATSASTHTVGGVTTAVAVVAGAPAEGLEDIVDHVATSAVGGGAASLGTALLVRQLGMPPAAVATLAGLVGSITVAAIHTYVFHHHPAPTAIDSAVV